MEAQRSTYTYTPLNKARSQIRLLHILPKYDQLSENAGSETLELAGSCFPNDAICCRLSLATLDDPPAFEALSYAWGDPKHVMSIQIEGHAIPVTKNLHDALIHLRRDYTERICWVDAVCINQGDIDERSSQVTQMEHIYRCALQIVVFLGNYWEGCQVAMDFIEVVGRCGDLHIDPLLEPHMTSHGMDFNSELLRDYLIRFFGLSWWNRGWVVQEFALSRRNIIMCGTRLLDAQILGRFIEHLYRHSSTCCIKTPYRHIRNLEGRNLYESMQGAGSLYEFCNLGGSNEDIVVIAATFRNQQCSDPRDKIYSLLGLADPAYRQLIQVNYALSTKDVLESTFAASVALTKSLDILSHVYDQKYSNINTASFVPDWTIQVDQALEARLSGARSRVMIQLYDASCGSKAQILFREGLGVTRAIIIDEISDVTQINRENWASSKSRCRQVGRIDETAFGPYVSRETALWKTLCGDSYGLPIGGADRPTRMGVDGEKMYQDWETAGANPGSESTYAKGAAVFRLSLALVSSCRQFIITRTGYIGFAPEACQVGDKVMLMPGGKVPYVLRRVEGQWIGPKDAETLPTPLYSFIGDAYIHGVMDGEAYDTEKLEAIALI
jgi:hypothetical protein